MPIQSGSLIRSLLAAVTVTSCMMFSVAPAQAQTPAAPAAASETVAATAAPATPAPAAADASAKKADEKAENPYGPMAMINHADWITRFVLLLLVIMSLGSWYIAIVKIIEQSRVMRQASNTTKKFWAAGTVAQGVAALDKNSPFRFIAESANSAVQKHDGLMGHIPLNDWISMSIQRSVDRIQSSMQGGLAFLATVGSVSPFVGLFGTVWGILSALTAIGVSGQASIDKVAGPVGEALIMTAIGLAVAVPAVLAYNWLVRRNKQVMDQVREFGSDLHAVVLGSVSHKS